MKTGNNLSIREVDLTWEQFFDLVRTSRTYGDLPEALIPLERSIYNNGQQYDPASKELVALYTETEGEKFKRQAPWIGLWLFGCWLFGHLVRDEHDFTLAMEVGHILLGMIFSAIIYFPVMLFLGFFKVMDDLTDR